VQQPRRVRTDLQPGADLAQLVRLLVDVDLEPVPAQAQCCGQAADAGSDDDDAPLDHRTSVLRTIVTTLEAAA
jgi:hypothetical protein